MSLKTETSIGLITEPERLFIYQQDVCLTISFGRFGRFGESFVGIGMISFGNDVL